MAASLASLDGRIRISRLEFAESPVIATIYSNLFGGTYYHYIAGTVHHTGTLLQIEGLLNGSGCQECVMDFHYFFWQGKHLIAHSLGPSGVLFTELFSPGEETCEYDVSPHQRTCVGWLDPEQLSDAFSRRTVNTIQFMQVGFGGNEFIFNNATSLSTATIEDLFTEPVLIELDTYTGSPEGDPIADILFNRLIQDDVDPSIFYALASTRICDVPTECGLHFIVLQVDEEQQIQERSRLFLPEYFSNSGAVLSPRFELLDSHRLVAVLLLPPTPQGRDPGMWLVDVTNPDSPVAPEEPVFVLPREVIPGEIDEFIALVSAADDLLFVPWDQDVQIWHATSD